MSDTDDTNETDDVNDDVSAADRANGEPDATEESRTGEQQAHENAENDPPA